MLLVWCWVSLGKEKKKNEEKEEEKVRALRLIVKVKKRKEKRWYEKWEKMMEKSRSGPDILAKAYLLRPPLNNNTNKKLSEWVSDSSRWRSENDLFLYTKNKISFSWKRGSIFFVEEMFRKFAAATFFKSFFCLNFKASQSDAQVRFPDLKLSLRFVICCCCCWFFSMAIIKKWNDWIEIKIYDIFVSMPFPNL